MAKKKATLEKIAYNKAWKRSKRPPYEPIPSLDGEIWLPIIGYEGLYEISNKSRVKSVQRINSYGRIIRESIIKKIIRQGYNRIRVYRDSVFETKMVSRLVAIHFIPNPENKPQVNHINGLKWDDRVENLEWVTNSENVTHAFRTGLNSFVGEKHPLSKLSNEQALAIFVSKSTTRELATAYGVAPNTITGIKTGKQWASVTGMKYTRKHNKV